MNTTPPPIDWPITGSVSGMPAVIVYDANSKVKARDAQWMERIQKLEAEIAALRPDAERYRWLRDEAQWHDGVPQAIIWKTNGDHQEICAEEELDAAIDAARTALESKT